LLAISSGTGTDSLYHVNIDKHEVLLEELQVEVIHDIFEAELVHVVRLIAILRLSYFRVMIEEINSQERLEFTADNLPASIKLGDLVFVKDSLTDFEVKNILSSLLVDLRFISGVREFRVEIIVEFPLLSFHLINSIAVVSKSVLG
jgi:hypothetical protein